LVRRFKSRTTENRNDLRLFEYDAHFEIIKSIVKWTLKEVEDYLEKNNVPKCITKKGFVSIGCAPCTKSHHPDEDIRADDGGGIQSQRMGVTKPSLQRGINKLKMIVTK
jgi:3'-phosphoadenosine 5'-phosphosulfate sulfotransferase (PAPS reductase)/FAD synthetase